MRIRDLFDNLTTVQKEVPFILAEAGVNHEGSMEIARRLINEAAEGGAHGIKFQSYKAETLASQYSPSYWDLSKESTESQFLLFKKYDRFWKTEYEQLKRHCDKVGIEFLSTPFDVESASFLNDLMDVYKISSSDITNLPFIEYLCNFSKPILLSTGASFMWEIQQAVELIESKGNPLCLMHCILNYPTEDQNANLGMLRDISQKFPNAILGYSDHTMPADTEVLQIAALLGAQLIEKHFTHDKSLPGNDHYHAMDLADLKHYFERRARISELVGSYKKYSLASEERSRRNARRSLVATREIREGTAITNGDLTWKRPAHGISPKYISEVIGSVARRNISQDELINWDMITRPN